MTGGSCQGGACDGATARPLGTPCDDGDPCTATDACDGAGCAGAPVDCSGLDGACQTGACEPGTGACVAAAAPDGAPCDDGLACSAGDVCADGHCAGDTAGCACIGAPDDAPCDDADPCTVADACAGGACVGAPADCGAFDTPCTRAICAPGVGCGSTPRLTAASCDDHDPCTLGDTCVGGACLGAAADCGGDDPPCGVRVCDAAAGGCVVAPLPDGAACDDADPCTAGDTCGGGACGGATDLCGACQGLALGDGCTVDDPCAQAGRCQWAGPLLLCVAPPVDCAAWDTPCADGYARVGAACENIDECAAGTADCPANSGCVDSPGGFACACDSGFLPIGSLCLAPCTAGYTRADGATEHAAGGCAELLCEIAVSELLPECLTAWSSDCARCANGETVAGGVECGAAAAIADCVACHDVDECADGTAGCDVHATCDNVPGGVNCDCGPGWTGDGHSCDDLDECAAGTAGCHADAACANTPGGFTCTCDAGFVGDGTACDNVDECADGSADCDPVDASCTDTAGSFGCACVSGFFGDGRACDPCATCTQRQYLVSACTGATGALRLRRRLRAERRRPVLRRRHRGLRGRHP